MPTQYAFSENTKVGIWSLKMVLIPCIIMALKQRPYNSFTVQPGLKSQDSENLAPS